MKFLDRADAGRRLAGKLAHLNDRQPVVLISASPSLAVACRKARNCSGVMLANLALPPELGARQGSAPRSLPNHVAIAPAGTLPTPKCATFSARFTSQSARPWPRSGECQSGCGRPDQGNASGCGRPSFLLYGKRIRKSTKGSTCAPPGAMHPSPPAHVPVLGGLPAAIAVLLAGLPGAPEIKSFAPPRQSTLEPDPD